MTGASGIKEPLLGGKEEVLTFGRLFGGLEKKKNDSENTSGVFPRVRDCTSFSIPPMSNVVS